MVATTYSIVIAGISGSGTSTGFIDNSTVYDYINAGGDAPSTYAASLAKARGNRRYRKILLMLSDMTNAYVTSVVGTGGDANTNHTSIEFDVTIEQGDSALNTPNESSPGNFLTGTAAIKRCVARALVTDETRNIEVLDPTAATAPGNSNSVARSGARFNIEVIGKLANNLATAEASITVTKLS